MVSKTAKFCIKAHFAIKNFFYERSKNKGCRDNPIGCFVWDQLDTIGPKVPFSKAVGTQKQGGQGSQKGLPWLKTNKDSRETNIVKKGE